MKQKILTAETYQFVKVFVQTSDERLHRIATIPKTAGEYVDIKSLVAAISKGTKPAKEAEGENE